MKVPIKLNLGAGSQKIKGYISVDSEPKCNPDVLVDFTKKRLPYKEKSVDEIVMFHTIEHIQKRYHRFIIKECFRVLKVDAKLYLSYPEFWECARRWKDNYLGMKEFWENTIFGLQAYPSDFHVCIMDPPELELQLRDAGFLEIKTKPEKEEPYYKITVGVRGKKPGLIPYEELVASDTQKVILKGNVK